MKRKCPNCNKHVEPANQYHPFCSDRCRLIDLGGWLDGTHKIKDKDDSRLYLPDESTDLKH